MVPTFSVQMLIVVVDDNMGNGIVIYGVRSFRTANPFHQRWWLRRLGEHRLDSFVLPLPMQKVKFPGVTTVRSILPLGGEQEIAGKVDAGKINQTAKYFAITFRHATIGIGYGHHIGAWCGNCCDGVLSPVVHWSLQTHWHWVLVRRRFDHCINWADHWSGE